MSDQPLSQMQTELLASLLDPSTLDADSQTHPLPEWISRLPIDRLHLVADMAFRKRLAKIESVFPRTLDCLADSRTVIEEFFRRSYPQTHISKLANSEQFLRCIEELCHSLAGTPDHLADVARLELALWKVSRINDDGDRSVPAVTSMQSPKHWAVSERIVFLTLSHDIRPIIDDSIPGTPPLSFPRTDTYLAVSVSRLDGRPTIVELAEEIFVLLAPSEQHVSTLGAGDCGDLDSCELRSLADLGIIDLIE